ncbi:ATP synthase subunit AtpR [uncultured Marivita sp.]|uniref:ATP synthase subunit AtpR n=1 Tax=uncultured Marivita sp. TaxID=888080 RepID=UPI0026227696|nr:ATP synthase subunit AtpR [uncultured Marivita sp.]
MDWTALALGSAAGMFMSVLFFAGLALGMKRAIRTELAVQTLIFSAALRISLFLASGWLVVMQAGPWAFAGYGIAFFVCRRIATSIARNQIPQEIGE